MKWFVFLLLFLFLFAFCSIPEKKDTVIEHSRGNLYAKGFSINNIDDKVYKITIKNPWQEAENIKFEYIFTKESKAQSSDTLTVPNRIICLSTTHVAFIEKLGVSNNIVGVSNPQYVYSKTIQDNYKNGLIADIGFDQGLNYETIINTNPDLMFIYGVGGENIQLLNKLEQIGIQTIIIGEYLEENPLAKLEWIKLFGLLLDKEEEANNYFKQVSEEYQAILELIATKSNGPKVMFNLPWEGTWFVPGGKSYAAQLLYDCKADYIWKDNESRSTIPLSIESVLVKSNEADIWLHPGNAHSKADILIEEERLVNFEPYKTGEIYNFNKRLTNSGGNDYWESGVVNPHLILKDLISILHPDVLPDHEFYYYLKVE